MLVSAHRTVWPGGPLGVIVLFLLGCSTPSNFAIPGGPVPAGDLRILQRDSKFAEPEVQVAAGRDVTFVVENDDKKTAHNLHFPTLAGSPKTKLELGPKYQTITVRFDKPGVYQFRCDTHLETMQGHVTAI